jgi:hypothetical protein
MEVGTQYVKSLKDVDIGPERGLSGSAGSAVCGRAGMSWLLWPAAGPRSG